MTTNKMKTLLTTLNVIAMIGLSGTALADEATGTIQQIDEAKNALILEDGTVYQLTAGVKLEGIEPGTPVKVTYTEQDGEKIAVQVQPEE